MDTYYINAHDWTEVVQYEMDKGYFDGAAHHQKLSQCHEAELLDYGVPNPFKEVTANDVAMFRRIGETITSYLADITLIDEALEAFICDIRYRLRRKNTKTNCTVSADEESDEATSLHDAVNRILAFASQDSGLDEVDLTWALKRASKIAALGPRLPRTTSSQPLARTSSVVRYYQDTTNPFDLTFQFNGKWYQGGGQVDSVHLGSLSEISNIAAEWICDVGYDLRYRWAEFKPIYGALGIIAELGSRYQFTSNDKAFENKYETLVRELEEGHEELKDFIAMVEDSRRAAIRTRRTVRRVMRNEHVDEYQLFQVHHAIEFD